MRYLVIGTEGSPVPGTGDLTMEAIQTLVGGDFEALPHPMGIDATVLAGTNAKMEGRPANHAATRLLSGRLRPGDIVVGTVVVVGPINAEGEVTDLPEETAKVIADRVQP